MAAGVGGVGGVGVAIEEGATVAVALVVMAAAAAVAVVMATAQRRLWVRGWAPVQARQSRWRNNKGGECRARRRIWWDRVWPRARRHR